MKRVLVALSLMVTVCTNAGDGWRSLWISSQKLDVVLSKAKELNFHAVIKQARKPEEIKTFAEKAKKAGLESYVWTHPKSPDKAFLQQISPEEEKIFQKQQELKKAKKLWDSGYQGGGEPLSGRKEVSLYHIPCIHCPEVLAATKTNIKNILDASPELTGIALDMFGYSNYSGCRCPVSLKAFEKFQKQHPELKEKDAWNKFCLESLVDFQNKVCEYARSLRPEIKTAVHVWPVYQPMPLYGNMLDLDYCCQTVAWFFKPYWSDQKIAEYTRQVVEQEKKYHQRQKGVPFIGYSGKTPERLERDLRIILKNDPSHSLSIGFGEILIKEDSYAVLQKVFREFGIIAAKK